MNYTPEQIELFNRLIQIRREYDTYISTDLAIEGLIENETTETRSHYTSQAIITLTDHTTFEIHYGDVDDTEEEAFHVFDKFLALGEDEEAWKNYLHNQTLFELCY